MDSTFIETLRFLVNDNKKLHAQFNELSTELKESNQDTEHVFGRLDSLEQQNSTQGAVNTTLSPGSDNEPSHNERLLDLPIERVIDTYSETPHLLEPFCSRAALRMQDNVPILEKSAQGNYWVLQLRDQGFYLLPRPGAFVRITALESLNHLFAYEGDRPIDSNDEFYVKMPAELTLLRRHQRWQLETKGFIRFGSAPLEFEWQLRLRKIQQDYQQIKDVLDTGSQANLKAEVAILDYKQRLQSNYGHPMRIFVNTCMPIAYALYRRPEDQQPWLVPCNVRLTPGESRVTPAWDEGVPWDSTIIGLAHNANQTDILRSSPDDLRLPRQPFMVDQTEQTWAIGADYEEASAIVFKLIDNWGPIQH